MKNVWFSVAAALICTIMFSVSTSARSISETKVVELKSAQDKQWVEFFGTSVEIAFGTNIPDCRCCYGGICSLKVNLPFFLKKGQLDDEYIASQVRGFRANDDASIGRTADGEMYLIFSRDITRPDFLGSSLTIAAPVYVDPTLTSKYNVPQIPAGTYDIFDNGLFKMIRIK
ncbi:MAG: hypothetical protein RL156_1576 [Bacteroidota bacterium]|jgi:hypothetical protein